MTEKEENPKKISEGWLYGWKEIGIYIGCSDKQAQIYASIYHLPIVRLPKNKPAAQPIEIDKWMKKKKK